MRIGILLVLVFPLWIDAAPQRGRMEGYFFTYKGRTFVTEHLGTTHPQFQMEWKDRASFKQACISPKPGVCPSAVISFVRSKRKKKMVLTDVRLISPFNDTDDTARYLTMLRAKTPKKK